MLLSGLFGLLGSLIYGSFLEWFIHKYVMHTNKISQLAFDRHAIAHHTERRSLKTFYIPPEDHATYHIGESSVVPLLWLAHLPFYYVVSRLFGMPAAVGLAVGGLLYLIGYETIHFFIHAPKNYWFQRTRVFRFYCEYHRVHHHKARWNYNIVLPIADFVLRTFTLEPIQPEPSAPPFVPKDEGPITALKKPQSVETT
jgi:hypothetical protein